MNHYHYNFIIISLWIFIIIVISLLATFSHYPQVSKTLLNILADFNNTVDWMVLILSLISTRSSPFSRVLGTILSSPTMIGFTLTLMSHSFFQLFGKVRVFIYLFVFFYFHSVVCQNGQILKLANPFFLFVNQH